MPLRISDLIRRTARIVQDAGGTRWTDAEWLDWFNDGRRELAVIRPSEFSMRVSCPLERGTVQQLPADNFQLLRIDCNLRTIAPRVVGRAVTQVERSILDAMNPRWREEAVYPFSREAKHFIYSLEEPTEFEVFPGNDGTGVVELVVAVAPAEETATGANIGVRDLYANALVDYMLYRAFSKDTDIPRVAERAGSHYAMFASALGMHGSQDAQAPRADA